MDAHIFLLVLSFIMLILSPHFSSSSSSSSSVSESSLKEGSSLSVGDILVSPNGVFSAGFFQVGRNAYCFSIWFSKPSCSATVNHDCTIVWMANRNYPVNGKSSKLWLKKTGNLVLTDGGDKFIAWSTSTVSHSSTVELILYDTGTLVLQNSQGDNTLWQSFDSPTDTLLPFQKFTRNMQLVSSRSRTDFSSGFYKLLFNNDNLLRLLYDGVEDTSIYWPDPWIVSWAISKRFAYNSSRLAFLDSLGKFTSSDNLTFLSSDYGETRVQRRLTIDFDGNLRLYSRKESNSSWVVTWQALTRPCEVHGICGANSLCKYDPFSGRTCSCLPGFKVKNPADWSHGCEPEIKTLSCGIGNVPESRNQVGFMKFTHVQFYGYDYAMKPGYTFQMCEELCVSLCDCKGFEYKYVEYGSWILFSVINNMRPTTIPTVCYIKMALLNGQNSPNFLGGNFHLKVHKASVFSTEQGSSRSGLNCSSEIVRPIDRTYPESNPNSILDFMLWFSIILGAVEIIGIVLVWCSLNSFHFQASSFEAAHGYNQFLAVSGFKRFTYNELKKATTNFRVEIGRGTEGNVFKGTLSDNRIAAIKRLNTSDDQGEAEFLAEVSTIGKLNHMNLIEMWGYCAEKEHKLLVYGYMKNGTLAENLASKQLDWRKRYQIAIGTARGLAYLHEECLEWVLHCDVKPQNILLDSNYNPKVSDFGLSKLLNREEMSNSGFSRIRGTRGYMAPEWVLNLPITSKVDVFSYGVVVLEMVTGKSPVMEEMTGGLVKWVREKKNGVDESWIEEIIDPKLVGEYDRDEVEVLVTLALQCVEEDKDSRPSMSKVVELLLSA